MQAELQKQRKVIDALEIECRDFKLQTMHQESTIDRLKADLAKERTTRIDIEIRCCEVEKELISVTKDKDLYYKDAMSMTDLHIGCMQDLSIEALSKENANLKDDIVKLNAQLTVSMNDHIDAHHRACISEEQVQVLRGELHDIAGTGIQDLITTSKKKIQKLNDEVERWTDVIVDMEKQLKDSYKERRVVGKELITVTQERDELRKQYADLLQVVDNLRYIICAKDEKLRQISKLANEISEGFATCQPILPADTVLRPQ